LHSSTFFVLQPVQTSFCCLEFTSTYRGYRISSKDKLMTKDDSSGAISRRTLLKATTVAAGASGAVCAATPPAGATRSIAALLAPATTTVKVNGQRYALAVDPRVTLLDALRETLRLTGTKKGCDQGQCGACTVLINQRRVNSCLTLAVMHDGDEIQTIEGLGTPEKLHPMQAAFVRHDAFQCGYCTPGQICSAVGMLNEIRSNIPSHVSDDLNARVTFSEAEVRERMSGNICRCAAYANIVTAISAAKGVKA
jgi:xanthine dehydrogenase YagT iron-sulfur-binding subunit